MNNLNVAVIGVGGIGSNHARILSDTEGVNLVGIVDTRPEQLERISRRFNVKGYATLDDLLMNETALDAVMICVPTAHHYAVAQQVISEKINLLIEKPIASSIEQARDLVAQAAAAGVILTVGHVERFNPAVIELRKRITEGELGHVFQVEAHRASPFPAHVLDVGVVIDLAVHDLDVMRYITESEIVRVYAEVSRRVHKSCEDQLIGILRFADETIGKITVNWLTPTKIRQLSVLGERGMFAVNYISQDLTFYENAAIEKTEWPQFDVMQGVKQGRKISYYVPPKEPLRAELESFMDAIRTNTPPIVSGEDGIQAVKLAEQLIQAGELHQSIGSS